MLTENELKVIQAALNYLSNDLDDFEVYEIIAGPLRKRNHFKITDFVADLHTKMDQLIRLSAKPLTDKTSNQLPYL